MTVPTFLPCALELWPIFWKFILISTGLNIFALLTSVIFESGHFRRHFYFTNTSCFYWFYCFHWLRTVVGTRVRIGYQHPLRVVKCDLMRLSYGWERKTEALCQSKFATIKIPFFSNAVLRCLAYIKCYSKLLITVSTDELLRAVWGLEFVNSTLFTLRMTLLLNVKWVIMLWISAFSVIVRWIVL